MWSRPTKRLAQPKTLTDGLLAHAAATSSVWTTPSARTSGKNANAYGELHVRHARVPSRLFARCPSARFRSPARSRGFAAASVGVGLVCRT
jgi:hypothetical protein